MTMPAGAQVSGYTIERVLGAGGMGTVYLARHPTLPRSVALKVLSAELSADPEFRARFRREADLAASLEHPNIVRVYTRGEAEDGRLWIAMQFIDGTDAGALADQGPIPVERTLHIVGEVAKALDFAHSRRLLHRDIKPANFLLTGEPGPHERVLLADFGIARAVEEATRLTATGSMMATVAYASPEAIEGRPVDHRSDLYSLGCALYRMLAGRSPFQDAGTMSAIMMAHLSRPAPPVTGFAPQLPPAIDAVLAIALAKDPAARFDTARQLFEAAQAALRHNQYPAQPVPDAATTALSGSGGEPVTYPSGRFSGAVAKLSKARTNRRNAWLLGAGVLAAVALLAIVLVTGNSGTGKPPYPAQSFNHTFGSTQLDHRPHAVAALTLADADVALSLGVQPIALVSPGGDAPPEWLADLIDGDPKVLAGPDAKALDEVTPDLIIDTGDLNKTQYDQLAEVAPTVTRPTNAGKGLGADLRLSWLASVLGEQGPADEVRAQLKTDQDKIRAENPKLTGPSISVFGFSDDGITALLSNSPAASYLSSVGLTYNPKMQSGADGAEQKPVPQDGMYQYRSTLALVMRTDADAGSGGFFGLPSTLENFSGTVIIVDDPDTIAALNSGGPAATRYLNDTLLPTVTDELS
ncbi:MAG TPA: serine/threonine-protein kinase [Mycolicibacillus parakoreensis]|uniref:non-specific serine/threonine protein kinase n=1 Tax=Mycolicibacillus parakoreensis TaxID=1069221 RepID=A0ABY3U055_9MYCO|nr:serine/threonine-protein kinase [Mycolicibacillus parakoreensis]ULN53345.1 serine/threonine-protein kinase [Mycolicibacillus parakoreensis]HLR99313.1 serine/threonine-protein kinase [Mycolicibacillus parakoreensis]